MRREGDNGIGGRRRRRRGDGMGWEEDKDEE